MNISVNRELFYCTVGSAQCGIIILNYFKLDSNFNKTRIKSKIKIEKRIQIKLQRNSIK